MFEGSTLNEIVDEWIARMNISGMDFTNFYCVDWIDPDMKNRQNKLFGRKSTLEIMEML